MIYDFSENGLEEDEGNFRKLGIIFSAIDPEINWNDVSSIKLIGAIEYGLKEDEGKF